MKQFLFIFCLACSSLNLIAQNLELLDRQEFYQTSSVQRLKIPLALKNNTDKVQSFTIRKITNDLGHSTKGYFCINHNCQELWVNDISASIEPNETLQNLYYVIETGIISGQTSLKFEISQKGNPKEIIEHNLTINIEEKSKPFIFQSKEISIQDVYPNPAADQAYIDYKIHDENVKVKLLIHNILGRILGDYQLPSSETKIKIPTEDLPTGVYFYTLYLDQEGVLTRKLVVRK